MKLLIITQKIDLNDSDLGFFHDWLEKLAHKIEKLIVICLEKGEYTLPSNVKVLSLGKEERKSWLLYLWNFYRYIFKYQREYDGVFVHMNTEYVILGGVFWRWWNKKVLFWYTHRVVDWRLRLSEKLATRIFTASRESFRLLSKKVEIMGHGIGVEEYARRAFNQPPAGAYRLLVAGRISPAKDLDTVIRAIVELKNKQEAPSVILRIVGESILLKDKGYESNIRKLAQSLNVCVIFEGGVSNQQMPRIYQQSHLLIHTSRTGSIDKVVLEALASGRLVISSSEAFADLTKEGLAYAFPQGDYKALADKIEEVYKSGALKRLPNQRAIDYVRENHNLDNLIERIIKFYK